MEISLTRSDGESNHLGVSICRSRLAARCASHLTSHVHSGYKCPIRDLATNAVSNSARMDAIRARLGAVRYGDHRGGAALWHCPAAQWPAAAIAGGSRRPDLHAGSGGSRVALRPGRSTRVRPPCRGPALCWAADFRSRRPHRRHRPVAWRRSGHPKCRRFHGPRLELIIPGFEPIWKRRSYRRRRLVPVVFSLPAIRIESRTAVHQGGRPGGGVTESRERRQTIGRLEISPGIGV